MSDTFYPSLGDTRPTASQHAAATGRSSERGWALLGVILMLTIMSIFLASSIMPNVPIQVQREKEEELYYRGNQMAKAIARYYGGGRLGAINFPPPPPYGYLTELKKLRDGVMIGVREIKFARASELIDPMTGEEWEPVRARDPRLLNVLNGYLVETGNTPPNFYWALAGPQKTIRLTPTDSSKTSPPGSNSQPGGQTGGAGKKPPADPNDPDADPDDDDDDDDPFADLFKDSNSPIIGVAPKRKGEALRPLYGLKNYQEWVFIYIPNFGQFPQNPGGPQRISP